MATNNAINGDYLLTTYTSNGSWTMNARTKYVEVYAWGGGAGGGSGCKGLVDNAAGGNGGAPGNFVQLSIPASMMATSAHTVTIAATANGATSQAADDTDGNTGTTGNRTEFGTSLLDSGTVQGGVGGTVTDGSPGTGAASYVYGCPRAGNPGVLTGAGGVGSEASTVGTSYFYQYLGTPGGGGGGMGNNYTGGAGGAIQGAFTAGFNGGSSSSASGTINGGNGVAGNVFGTQPGYYSGGTGGGGGVGKLDLSATGTGGNGGIPSGAGGGGGAGLNLLVNSGAGGSGARGEVIVIEWF